MNALGLLKIDRRKLRALDTEKLRFLRDVGRHGLDVWQGAPEQMDQVRGIVAKLDAELRRRKEES